MSGMLSWKDKGIQEAFLEGNFGLEKESLRILDDGHFADSAHLFPAEDRNIVRDFCENQTEINTGVNGSAHGAVQELRAHDWRIRETLSGLEPREYLWPFSNPPFIRGEEEIPVASFEGALRNKTVYRDYLSSKYGRYKMTFSGIHVNFSFGDTLLQRACACAVREGSMKGFPEAGDEGEFREFKSRLYLKLAQGLLEYGWILTVLTAASPLLDSSFWEKGRTGGTCFSGMASVRCSELGYWNDFVPVLSYEDLDSYTKSIRRYVEEGYLNAPSELYYPIRLKSEGENDLEVLRTRGVSHIELRMFDLNPFAEGCVEEKDVFFAHLLMLWIACTYDNVMRAPDQLRAVFNFKKAARYDLRTVRYVTEDGVSVPMEDAAREILRNMELFYAGLPEGVISGKEKSIIDFERDKLENPEKRYAYRVREAYEEGFVNKALRALSGGAGTEKDRSF